MICAYVNCVCNLHTFYAHVYVYVYVYVIDIYKTLIYSCDLFS
jgi:hypothetical protein